jgi:hypothetical protein
MREHNRSLGYRRGGIRSTRKIVELDLPAMSSRVGLLQSRARLDNPTERLLKIGQFSTTADQCRPGQSRSEPPKRTRRVLGAFRP